MSSRTTPRGAGATPRGAATALMPKPPPLPPAMLGLSMSPRAWKQSESYDLPLGAPELIKPARRGSNGEKAKAVSAEAFEVLLPPRKAATEDAAAAPAAEGDATAADETPRKPPSLRMAALAVGFGTSGSAWHPRTAEEIALANGHLSGARVCQALLQGDLAPQSSEVQFVMPDFSSLLLRKMNEEGNKDGKHRGEAHFMWTPASESSIPLSLNGTPSIRALFDLCRLKKRDTMLGSWVAAAPLVKIKLTQCSCHSPPILVSSES